MSDELGDQLVERFTKEEGHDMSENGFFDNELSRRDAMKTAVKAGAYAAPVVLAASVPGMGVAAASAVPSATNTPAPGATNTPTPAQVGLQINSASATQTPTARTCSGIPAGAANDDFQFVENVSASVTNGGPGTVFDVFIAAPSFDVPAATVPPTTLPTTQTFPGFGTAYRIGTFTVSSNGSGVFNGSVLVSAFDNPPVFPNPLTLIFTFTGLTNIAGTQQISASNVNNVRCISGPLST